MTDNDWITALEETARNLKHQSQVLRQQSKDLSKDSVRIRALVRKARQKRASNKINKSNKRNGRK
jgi:hypothetical protein